MPPLFIHVRNSDFDARDEGSNYDGPEAALKLGIGSAVALAGDEIARGRPGAAVEVIIERKDKSQVLRSVVTLSVCPLILADEGDNSD